MAGTPLQIAMSVMRTGEKLRTLLEEAYSPLQLNEPRAEVLETIAAAGEGGCSQTELAEALGASESNISTLVERMRRDGLLYRMRSKLDRRCSVLLLSEEGRDKLQRVVTTRETRLAESMQCLTAPDRQVLRDLHSRWAAALAHLPQGVPASGIASPTQQRGAA